MTGDKEVVTSAGRVTGATEQMGAAAKAANTQTAAASQTVAAQWEKAGNRMTAAGKKMNRGVTLPVLAITAVTGKLAIDFEKSMRNVNSIAQLPERSFQRLNREVLNLAGKTAQAPKTLAEGLYDLVSSGFNASESITILGASARAATAGLTTTEVSTKAVAAALNAYHRPAADAKQISDDLFQTVNLGVITFDELASVIGYVLPAASSLGVDIKQVGASISTLTKEGQSGSNAVTNINAAMTAFLKPTKEMKSVLKELGYENSVQLIHQKGFQGALEAVTGAVHGDKEAIAGLFSNVRAMRAVFGLTGKSAKSAGEDLQGFQSDTGATAKVLKEQSKTLAYQWNQLKAEASKLGIEVGNKLIPVFRSLAGDLMGAVKWFTELPEGVQTSTLKLLAFGAAMGPVLRIGGAFATMIGGIAKGMKWLAATDIAAGVAQALHGDTAILQIAGGDLATTVMGGLARALPIAAAGAGIINILSSVIGGDSKGAMEKTGGAIGGALLGGIIGSVVPGLGTAVGAMVGGGAGSFLGPIIGDLFTSEKKLTPLQQRLQRTAQATTAAMHGQAQATHELARAQDRLDNANHRHAQATDRVKKAQQEYRQALRKFGPDSLPALQAALRLARAEREEKNAAEDAKRAKKLSGIQLEIFKAQTTRAVAATNRQIPALRHTVDALTKKWRTEKDNVPLTERLSTKVGELEKVEGKRNRLLKEAADQNPKWARGLQQMSQGVSRFVGEAGKMRSSLASVPQAAEHSAGLLQQAFEGKNTSFVATFRRARAEAKKQLGEGQQIMRTFGKQGAGSFGELAVNVYQADKSMTDNTGAMLKGFGAAKLPKFSLSVPKGKEAGPGFNRGGTIMVVPGKGLDDTVPLQGPGINAVVAPGETLAAINRHQRPELDFAVANTFGDRGLDGFFTRSKRPHKMQRGGIAKKGAGLPEPQLGGTDPLRAGGQAAIHMAHSAAENWLSKHMGPKPGLGNFDGKPVSDWIIPILTWARAHGWGGSVTSGYRSPSEQIAAATAYGLGHYGSAGPLGSNHVGINYPRGAVDVTAAAQLAAILKGYPGKPNLVWGGPVMGDYVHFSATGHQRGGFIPAGAMRLANGGWVKTGYTIYTGSGPGAGGDLQKGHGYAELGTATSGGAGTGHGYIAQALGRSGELPFEFPLDVKIGAREATLYKRDRGYGQGTPAYSIDIHQLAWNELGLSMANGKGSAFIRPGSGAPAGGGGSENVPAVFHGVRTGTLNFPSMPKSLHGVNKEIAKWEAAISRYRHALKAAKGKPKVEGALQKNVTAIEGWLKQLRRQRALLRRKAAQKKITRRLGRRLGKITGIEQEMTGAERAFTIAEQYAQQVVDLEPQQPETEDAGGEAKYVQALTDYIENQERPAYMNVLDTLATWRNTTLLGESTASRLESGWEREVRGVDNEIQTINDFTAKVGKDKERWHREHPKQDFPKWIKDEIAKDHKERSRLPMLHFRDREVRKAVGEARGEFYGGRKDPLQPPQAPLAGSGTIEDVLSGIQGTHWPDQHSPLSASALAPPRRPGAFGGSIWDVQTAIEELGLKIKQAGGGGGGGSGAGEREQLLEEENLRLKREALVAAAQAPVLSNYLGAYKTGGTLPADGFYYGHKDETVVPAESGPLTETHVHLSEREGVLGELLDIAVEERLTETGRRVGLARAMPSVPGRRAAFTQRQRRG